MKWRFETLLVIVLLLFCLPAGVGAMSSTGEEPEILHPAIVEVNGEVAVRGVKSLAWQDAREGMLLLSGDILRTGKGAFARVQFSSGVMEIYETTVVVIPSIGFENRKKDIREVIVEEGKTLFDINPLGVERGFQFRTKNIQGGVKGTLFTVSYVEGGTAVNVYRGVVVVSDLDRSEETSVKLAAGKSVRVEKKADFGRVQRFDPSLALEDYKYKVPPGLSGKGLPADHNARPENKGGRKRGVGKSNSSDGGSDIGNSDGSDDDQGDDDDEQ